MLLVVSLANLSGMHRWNSIFLNCFMRLYQGFEWLLLPLEAAYLTQSTHIIGRFVYCIYFLVVYILESFWIFLIYGRVWSPLFYRFQAVLTFILEILCNWEVGRRLIEIQRLIWWKLFDFVLGNTLNWHISPVTLFSQFQRRF